MLRKLRIGPKLLLAPGLVLLLLLALSGASYYGMVRQNASLENLVQVRAARLRDATDATATARQVHSDTYRLLAWTNGSFARQRLDRLTADIHKRHAALGASLAGLEKVANPDEGKLARASIAAVAAYRKAVLETMELAQVDVSIATNSMQKAEAQFLVLGARLAELSALERTLSEKAYAVAAEEFRMLELAMWTLVLLSIVLSLAVSMAVRRSMLADIRAMTGVVGELAAGRLTAVAASDGRDEIADASRALDRTIGHLNGTMCTISDAVHSIDTASKEIANGNSDLSTRTELQAGSLQETASAIHTLTQAVTDTASNAKQANDLASKAVQLAGSGGEAVDRAVRTMDSIRASSRKVVEITSVIDGLAFQTNILALNAAVEAARAGEQGRGFAVVASEVRSLAQRSAAAAKEIKALIAESVTTIDGGSASVNQAGASMGDIVESVRQVNDIIGRISRASSEQACGIADVNRAVASMDDMTQQNAALVEQAAAAAESLHEQAANLARAVAVFQIAKPATAPQDRRAPDSPMRGGVPRLPLAERPAHETRPGQPEPPRNVHRL